MITLKSFKGDWFHLVIHDKDYYEDFSLNKDELVVLYKLIGRYIEKENKNKKIINNKIKKEIR